jgi:hypothetical protein
MVLKLKQQNCNVLLHFMLAMMALMMEASSTSETSVNFHQTTRRNNTEDSHLLIGY